jgi:hypothetical protein
VRGRQQRCVGVTELVDHRASRVDSHGPRAQSERGDQFAVSWIAVGLDRDRPRATRAQYLTQQRESLREA